MTDISPRVAERPRVLRALPATEPRPEWRKRLAALRRHKSGMLGLLLVALLVGAALLADVVWPKDPYLQDYGAVLVPPSRAFPLGTDDIGRDQLSRILHGARISLGVALTATTLSTIVGISMGLVSGYFGGWVDELVMRVTDALWAFPSVLLALAIAAALGRGVIPLIIALSVISIASMARLVRGQVLAVRSMDYVLAARALGAGHLSILWQHVLPNIMTPLVVAISLGLAGAILNEASLSFLGLGTQPPTPSWGTMLRSGYEYMGSAPWLGIFPGLAIFLAVLGFMLLGDGLQVVLDPRLQDRRRTG
jgi:peptide/nickel transport system permease protein